MDTAAAPLQPNTGHFVDEDAALSALLDRLGTGLDPHAVWLFGSRGRGDNRPDSDFDLMVVAKPGADWGSDDYARVYLATKGIGASRDVVPISFEDFEEAVQLPTTLAAAVLYEGRKLYEARR